VGLVFKCLCTLSVFSGNQTGNQEKVLVTKVAAIQSVVLK